MKKTTPNVLLISVDAVQRELLFGSKDYGIDLKNIRKFFVEDGTFAGEGMMSVFPTFTYPCHQSMITGVNPASHGIYNNGLFDPTGELNGGWNWFVSDKVPTLWELARDNGYISASMAFPTSLGAPCDYVIPEWWFCGLPSDTKFISLASTPQGMAAEMEKEIGQCPNGWDLSLDSDRMRQKGTLWIMKNKIAPHMEEKPFFLSTYFASYDDAAHEYGVYGQEALEVLQEIDTMLGELLEYAVNMTGGNLVVCLVSDHGMIDNTFNIRPNVLFKNAGLVTTDDRGDVIDWRIFSQRSGGTAQICLKDKNDTEAKALAGKILYDLLNDPDSGISEVLTGEEAARLRFGYPECDYALISKKGFEIRDGVMGDYCTDKIYKTAQHGYDENYYEMRAIYGIWGKGIERNRDLGLARIVDIAPTLASIMGISMPTAEGIDLLKK